MVFYLWKWYKTWPLNRDDDKPVGFRVTYFQTDLLENVPFASRIVHTIASKKNAFRWMEPPTNTWKWRVCCEQRVFLGASLFPSCSIDSLSFVKHLVIAVIARLWLVASPHPGLLHGRWIMMDYIFLGRFYCSELMLWNVVKTIEDWWNTIPSGSQSHG